MHETHMTAHTDQHALIVGGGLSGLTAAGYLARGGVGVTLYEKASNLGGRAATQEHGGFLFNRGIHAVYTGGAVSEVLAELGITYGHGSPKKAFVVDHGRLHPLPADPLSLLTSDLLSIADKIEFVRVTAGLGRIDTKSLARVSVQQWLERTFRRPQVRRLMRSLAWTFVYSAALDLVSAEVFVRKLQITLKNPVHYVDGGWQTLVDGLRRTAEAAGARIVSGGAVVAVEHEAGRIVGMRLANGATIPASAVIVATNPQDAVKLLGDGTYPALRGMVQSMHPAQVACLDVALRRLPHPEYPAAEDLDRPLFYSAQSLFARVAPKGEALVHAFKQLDPRHLGDPHEDERELEELLDAGQPGWREQVVKQVYLPRIAAVGMLPTASGGGFAGRPGVQVPGVPNLFLAGDWIGPEGFLSDACMASAREAARLLLADKQRPATKELTAVGR